NGLKRPQNGRTELEVPAGSPDQVRAAAARDALAAALQSRIAARRAGVFGPVPSAGGDGGALWLADALARNVDSRAVARLRAEAPRLPSAYVFQETSFPPPATYLLLRGQAASPGQEVAPGLPAVLSATPVAFPAQGERSSLRRLTLARWLARPDHPLTARVIVNRVWQHHFGEGLVRTPGDFGTMGELPTHPELLDWLAGWFVRHDWSIKALHRLILTSQTYRMSTRGNPAHAADDPENRLLWRSRYRRLDAEAIRDAMLAVSGRLNRRLYGPSMYPAIPREALEGHSDPDKAWKPSAEPEASRRSVYAFVKRSLPVPMLEVLDFCDTARPASKRNITTVAPQALTLLNSDFVNHQARYFADRLEREAGNGLVSQIERAFLLALARPPNDGERAATLRFLEESSARIAREQGVTASSAQRVALEQFCRAILNTNEFVYPD
ncbi:MAG: DUF1553 domain-containing protein, partial [Isosphaeraceae bacterium]|nr:DUF1553 domain-containing protein [Isosphaeraceae bacterium]